MTILLSRITQHMPPVFCLSATIALEHFTALLADGVFSDKRVTEGADPQYAAMWRWHSLEESEHKTVAYDVWDLVMGKGVGAYSLRSLGLVLATVIFWGLTIPAFLQALRQEGQLTNFKGWQKFFNFTLGTMIIASTCCRLISFWQSSKRLRRALLSLDEL